MRSLLHVATHTAVIMAAGLPILAATPSDWPQFRGQNCSGVSPSPWDISTKVSTATDCTMLLPLTGNNPNDSPARLLRDAAASHFSAAGV